MYKDTRNNIRDVFNSNNCSSNNKWVPRLMKKGFLSQILTFVLIFIIEDLKITASNDVKIMVTSFLQLWTSHTLRSKTQISETNQNKFISIKINAKNYIIRTFM